jgi:uncharacterized DUF497 family protein
MIDADFGWDDAKARRNYSRHGVTFEIAKKVFHDPSMVEILDEREDYGEERYLLIGMADGQLLSVIYTERNQRLRLISARRANRDEQDHYFTQNRKE